MSGRIARLIVIGAAAAGLSLSGVVPAWSSASPAWQIVKVVGVRGGVSQFTNVSAAGRDNAWAGGVRCPNPCSTPTPAVEHWNGHAWRSYPLPAALTAGSTDPVVAGRSATTWIFTENASNREYALHVTGKHETQAAFPVDVTISNAAVFSASNAWAFGATGVQDFKPLGAYAARYNGHSWTPVAVPVLPAGMSALSSGDLWIYGQTVKTLSGPPAAFAAARWTGHGWRTVKLPDLHLGSGFFMQPNGIAALGTHDVWVTGTLGKGQGIGDGVVLLNWNGKKWTRVFSPYPLSAFDADITADGAGGVWVTGYASRAQHYKGPYLYHYQRGHWSRQLAPTQKGGGAQFGGLALIPGTRDMWGAAELLNAGGSQAVIDKYVP